MHWLGLWIYKHLLLLISHTSFWFFWYRIPLSLDRKSILPPALFSFSSANRFLSWYRTVHTQWEMLSAPCSAVLLSEGILGNNLRDKYLYIVNSRCGLCYHCFIFHIFSVKLLFVLKKKAVACFRCWICKMKELRLFFLGSVFLKQNSFDPWRQIESQRRLWVWIYRNITHLSSLWSSCSQGFSDTGIHSFWFCTHEVNSFILFHVSKAKRLLGGKRFDKEAAACL